VQLGDLHGEPSVLVRLAPHMAGQQFPVGRVDMVGVPSAGDHNAHLREPVLDSAAQSDRAVENLDQPLREVRAQLRHAVDRLPVDRARRRREPIETGGAANVELALNRLAGQPQDVIAQASGIADSGRPASGT